MSNIEFLLQVLGLASVLFIMAKGFSLIHNFVQGIKKTERRLQGIDENLDFQINKILECRKKLSELQESERVTDGWIADTTDRIYGVEQDLEEIETKVCIRDGNLDDIGERLDEIELRIKKGRK